jgi:hypothetical protein
MIVRTQDPTMAQSKAASVWKKTMEKLGLSIPILLLMVKYGTCTFILPLRSQHTSKLTSEFQEVPLLRPLALPCKYHSLVFAYQRLLTRRRYQNSSVAARFTTIGYLIPIMSILTVPVLPRARFIQNFLVTCVRIPLEHILPVLD